MKMGITILILFYMYWVSLGLNEIIVPKCSKFFEEKVGSKCTILLNDNSDPFLGSSNSDMKTMTNEFALLWE